MVTGFQHLLILQDIVLVHSETNMGLSDVGYHFKGSGINIDGGINGRCMVYRGGSHGRCMVYRGGSHGSCMVYRGGSHGSCIMPLFIRNGGGTE